MDITLANADGDEVDMGSPIDEGAPPAAPNFFASASDPGTRRAHLHRGLLRHVMEAEGFRQHPGEWWHFSLGDQLWAWIVRETGGPRDTTAIYGRADLVK
jgi:D-alanyl-D-alanine dipeptidase